MALILTLVLGNFMALGAFISSYARNKAGIAHASVAMAFGTLLTLAVAELIPEAVEHLENHIMILVCVTFAGALLLKLFDICIPDHDHHFSEHGHAHAFTGRNVTHVGVVSTIAVSLHNVIEGMAVYSLASEHFSTGLLVALGVGLHNIPMGMVIATTLSGLDTMRLHCYLAAATFSTFFGGLLMSLLWGFINEFVIGILLALTLGMVLYIVFLELLPMLLHLKKWHLTAAYICVGGVLIVISRLLE